MQEQNEQILKDIFSAVFELGDGDDVTKIRKVTEQKWDSLALASIVAGMESEFSLQLDTNDFERLTSYAATRQFLAEKGL